MNRLTLFIVLYGFWLMWSGLFDLFHLSLGLISTLLVLFWSGDLLQGGSKKSIGRWFNSFLKLEVYSFWLVWQIVVANLQVLKVVFSTNVMETVSPQMVEFKTPIKSDMGKFVLAQSITLTPGTVTARIDNQSFMIHALTTEAAAGVPGVMQDKVAAIFQGEA